MWIACGPGNNGGDGLEAAVHLKAWGKDVVVTWLGHEAAAPADALASLHRARAAGVRFEDAAPQGMTAQDLCVDALLGIGASLGGHASGGHSRSPRHRTPEGRLAAMIQALNASAAPTLAVDLPSGLDADTGTSAPPSLADAAMYSVAGSAGNSSAGGLVHAQNTLSLLGLKPGLFTASGRDAAGQVWVDDLGVDTSTATPCAQLQGPPAASPRTHASHKGSYGDVAVIGGAPGMAGAALLAANAALHGGAGRVFVGLLDGTALPVDPVHPDLMLRPWPTLDLKAMTVVCGCGGGSAVRAPLPTVLANAARLVLDADALNAMATDAPSCERLAEHSGGPPGEPSGAALRVLLQARALAGQATVLTPHPLEAARLLGCSTAQVQANRLYAAQQLAERFSCTVVLKGSGSVIAAPGQTPVINPTGNALLATAGTGDVLAGMVAARWAGPSIPSEASFEAAFKAACSAVYQHGNTADHWPARRALTASALAAAQAGHH